MNKVVKNLIKCFFIGGLCALITAFLNAITQKMGYNIEAPLRIVAIIAMSFYIQHLVRTTT